MTFAAVLIISPDALLVRSIQSDVWTLLFWRCLLTAAMQSVFLALTFRRKFIESFHHIGRTGLLSASIVTIGSLLFVNSLRMTAAANTLIILAAAPLFASFFSWIFLREKVPQRTLVAILFCFGGILLIFSGSLQKGLLWGDLLALGATCMWGSNLVVIRSGKGVNMVPANLLGNLMVVPAALFAGAQPLSVSGDDMLLLLLLGGFVLPVSFTLITLGPRYLTAPEISLILLVETILGPIWVWLALGEIPGIHTIAAGLLIVGTLVTHTVLSLRAHQKLFVRPRMIR